MRRDLLDAFVGRVPAPAREALAPPPDGSALVATRGVDDLVVVLPAERAAHARAPYLPERGSIVEPGDRLARQQRGAAAGLRPARRRPSRGSDSGATRCAIDHSVSPGSTMTDSACGRRSTGTRGDPPSAAPACPATTTSPSAERHGDEPTPPVARRRRRGRRGGPECGARRAAVPGGGRGVVGQRGEGGSQGCGHFELLFSSCGAPAAGAGCPVERTIRVGQQRWPNVCSTVKPQIERVFVTNV